MKLAIATFHRAQNFGAMLQAVGLQQALSSLGHEVYFEDYWPADHAAVYQIWSRRQLARKSLKGKLYNAAISIALAPWLINRNRKFSRFYNQYIAPYCIPMTQPIDAVIYGSDQIWGRFPFRNFTFDPFYLAQNQIPTSRHIAYAASMGSTELNKEETELLTNALKHFDRIAVREADMCHKLQHLTDLPIQVVCDPTLLLTRNQWLALTPPQRLISEPYLLHYDLQHGSFSDSEIRLYASQRGLKVITIRGMVTLDVIKGKETASIGPAEFLQLFRDASFVFTSSFHGLVFAIQFQKQFFASYRAKASRAETLLQNVGLLDRLISPAEKLPNLKDIDYVIITPMVNKYREESLHFLKTI